MSSDGNMKEVFFYLLTCLLIFLAISWQKQIPPGKKIFLLSVYFVFYLFLLKQVLRVMQVMHLYLELLFCLQPCFYFLFLIHGSVIYLFLYH